MKNDLLECARVWQCDIQAADATQWWRHPSPWDIDSMVWGKGVIEEHYIKFFYLVKTAISFMKVLGKRYFTCIKWEIFEKEALLEQADDSNNLF